MTFSTQKLIRRLAAIGAVLSLMAAFPAQAATTVFASGVYSQSGAVTNVGNALGATDGAVASIGGFFSPGETVFTFGTVLSGASLQLTSVDRFLNSTLAISIGEEVGGVAVFSPEQMFVESTGGVFNFDLSGACSAISTYGCSLVRIRHTGGFSLGFGLDSVSAVSSAPEPSSWALMILGFAGLASRLKHQRRRKGGWVLAANPASRSNPAMAQ